MLWQLPNPSRFLDGITESLASSKHVIVMLPEPLLTSDPVSLLSKRLSHIGLGSLTEVQLRKSDHEDVLDAIVEELGYDQCEIDSVEAFLDMEDVPSRYIAITGVENCGLSWMSGLSNLISKAGEHAKVSENISFNLLALVSPRFSPPPDNLMLAHHTWWGVLSSVDIDHVTECHMADYPPSSIPEKYWLRAMCRGVAKTDPDLVQLIIETSPKSIDELCEIISCHRSDSFKDIPQKYFKYPDLSLGTAKIKPPNNGVLRELWNGGYLDWHDGSGIIFHPYLLYSCGLQQEIARMVWKGQMQIILPLAEQARQCIIFWLTREYGDHWPNILVGILPEEELSGLTSEIGPLCHYLFRNKSVIKHSSFAKMSDMGWKWRNIRNEISHGRSITFDMINDAYFAFDRVARCERLYVDFDDLMQVA